MIMNRLVLFFVFAILFTSLQFSCQKEVPIFNEDVATEHSKVGLSASAPQNTVLHNELKAFNSEFAAKVANRTDISEIESFWSVFTKVILIASADIIGFAGGLKAGAPIAALVGLPTGGAGAIAIEVSVGALAGASASLATSRELNYTKNVEYYESGYTINSVSPKYKPYTVSGKLHNEWVVKLDTNEDYYMYYLPEDVKKIVYDTAFIRKKKLMLDIIGRHRNDTNKKNLIKDLVQNDLINKNMGDIYELFFEAYDQSRTFDDIRTVVDTYTEKILFESNLPHEDKSVLIASFDVALESPYLWLSQKKDLFGGKIRPWK